jgi:hypothetical protein
MVKLPSPQVDFPKAPFLNIQLPEMLVNESGMDASNFASSA